MAVQCMGPKWWWWAIILQCFTSPWSSARGSSSPHRLTHKDYIEVWTKGWGQCHQNVRIRVSRHEQVLSANSWLCPKAILEGTHKGKEPLGYSNLQWDWWLQHPPPCRKQYPWQLNLPKQMFLLITCPFERRREGESKKKSLTLSWHEAIFSGSTSRSNRPCLLSQLLASCSSEKLSFCVQGPN